VKQVVLVTGAAGGVGSAVVERFTRSGWAAFGVDVREQPEHSPAEGWCVADLRQVGECRRAVSAAAAGGGRLDCVVNAAGVWTEGPSEATTEDEWDRVVDLNLKAVHFVSSAAIPHLRETAGCICNLSSDAGIQGNAGAAVYCASKGGVSNLTRALALELAPEGVRVNAVCPGDIDTPMLAYQAETFGGGDPAGYLRRLKDGYPQGSSARFLRADEVAELIWFLAQPHAAGITGANLSIDFGLSAGMT
jgi:NAD(P)-dependent dehydrogenase (short-subunit alcohol dehydrogenase family)